MVPYIIERAYPSDDMRDNNIIIYEGCCEKKSLDEEIMNYISENMDEFCSKDYGHDLKINSFNDFCNKYWDIAEYKIRGWDEIFRIYIFIDKWFEWSINDNKDKIFIYYKNKYINK